MGAEVETLKIDSLSYCPSCKALALQKQKESIASDSKHRKLGLWRVIITLFVLSAVVIILAIGQNPLIVLILLFVTVVLFTGKII